VGHPALGRAATHRRNRKKNPFARQHQAKPGKAILKVNMHQILVPSMTTSETPPHGTRSRRRIRWTDSVSVQALRMDAANLRTVAQAGMNMAGTATSHHPADLLQQAAILDTAADVLALTNWT
jgi:hypothetical protein